MLYIIELLVRNGANPDINCALHSECTPRMLAHIQESEKKEITAIFNQMPEQIPTTLKRCPSQSLLKAASQLDLQQLSKEATSQEAPDASCELAPNSPTDPEKPDLSLINLRKSL